MGKYTDEYVDELRARLRRQCDELESLSARLEAGDEEVVQALRASEAKDEELAKEREKKTALQSELRVRGERLRNLDGRWSDMTRAVNDLHIEVERLTFALKDKDEELAKERDKTSRMQSEEIAKLENLLDRSDETLIDTLKAVSDQSIEIERLTFALKDKDNELESVRDEHRTQIDKLMEEIERLTRKNKKRIKAAELRWLIDGHTNVLDAHRTAILQVREAIDQNKETLSAAQREMLATLDRHDGLISKAFGCIDNHSIYKQQQSIDNLWLYAQGIAAHINTGSSQENP